MRKWEQLNVSVRLGSLKFDLLFNRTLEPGYSSAYNPKHNHSVYELQFIIGGAGTLHIGEDAYELQPGTVHLIGPYVFHTIRKRKGSGMTNVAIQFSFHEAHDRADTFPGEEARQLKATLAAAGHIPFAEVSAASNAALFRLMEQMRAELLAPSAGAYAQIQGLFLQMLAAIMRADRSRDSVSYALPGKSKDDLRIPIAEQFFARCGEPLTLGQLADQLHLGPKQANRFLQRTYGQSFKEKLIESRLEIAKDLLRGSDKAIAFIAGEIGYSAAYFTRLFTARIGFSPAQYRDRGKRGSTS
ncbi:helix-turn-helix transcriptional regulator [Paenibacillus cymbidii]|uniref:helix-turn-helix transcriptional regulator n=1 Tax=Paenibacillus cymbidii TaxID=1639034 RepID=UPI001F459B4A|nr:AraC family transcriptional regulator [Paenibacillus cymbidii]